MTFTSLPHGLLGLIVSKASKKPFYIGIIGEKILRQLQSCKKLLVRPVLQCTGSITVPGEHFRERLITLGMCPEKTFVLPHGISPISSLG